MNQADGLVIARERISEEAKARTGFLDLGQLGLTELPEELFTLKHLHRLNLGSRMFDEVKQWWLDSSSNIAPNDIGSFLKRLNELSELRALSLYSCRLVSDLAPLAGLTALQTLACWSTQVSDLTPLASLTALQTLACWNTQVSDLAPLADLTALQTLYCWNTQVSDLAPLAGLTALQTLECWSTQVSDLTPLAGLTALHSLKCSGCSLIDFPRRLLELPSLEKLVLYRCHLSDVPAGVLSQSYDANCLEALRAHVHDLEAGSVAVSDVKLMVLGNGRVGKTQLCRRLRGEAYDETVPSTHGVLVTSASLPSANDGPATRLQIWDFGGQDIYHGTHALFMRTNAIFLLIWTPVLEDAQEHVHADMIFRNHPLAYWVDYQPVDDVSVVIMLARR